MPPYRSSRVPFTEFRPSRSTERCHPVGQLRDRTGCYASRVNAKTEKSRQKEVEFACIESMARALASKAVQEPESSQWPDGWLESPDGRKEPVEVVAAFRRPKGEDPRSGSVWLRDWKQAESAARSLAGRTGEAVSFHVDDDGFTLLDGENELPLATMPIRQDEWVLHAVRQKIAKNYSSNIPPILVVQLYSPLPLMDFEIERISAAIRSLGTQFKFGALWVVNDYGDPPVKIPT